MNTELEEDLLATLRVLAEEHADLNVTISETEKLADLDQIMLQRLKKRKLMLKDRIELVKSRLYPNIIA